jgi:hypothetical protein
LTRLKDLIDRGLSATSRMWPGVRAAFGWVHRAAHVLGQEGTGGARIRRQLSGLLGAMTHHRAKALALGRAVDHFVTVSRSYWPGLFHCYDTPELPRTNNDLERAFGSHRYHERRATGRKGASPALVLRGSVRLVAALATRQCAVGASDLAQAGRFRWQELRQELEERRRRRVERWRFRRDPEGYLNALENTLNQLGLPP